MLRKNITKNYFLLVCFIALFSYFLPNIVFAQSQELANPVGGTAGAIKNYNYKYVTDLKAETYHPLTNNLTSCTIKVSWIPPKGLPSNFQSYSIQFNPGTISSLAHMETYTDIKGSSVNIPNLECGKPYFISVNTKTDNGQIGIAEFAYTLGTPTAENTATTAPQEAVMTTVAEQPGLETQAQKQAALTVPAVMPLNSLHANLTAGADPNTAWVFTVWKICMTLANAFVAVIILFFAFVNVAHIEYDTYQIKKTLPKLIIGIIMANFSMVIVRMLADVASVLTNTFAQNTPDMMRGILCAMGLSPAGNVGEALLNAFTGVYWLWLMIIVLLVFLGILILGLLLLVRHSVILILAAVAPIAFIMLAFPPTEEYFKKWWDWEIKWVYMGPIMMLLLWMAGMVGGGGNIAAGGACPPGLGFNILRSFSALALVALACIVPFQFGGAVMGAIGGAMKGAAKLAANNPYSKRKIDMGKNALKHGFLGGTGVGRWMERGQMSDEAILEAQKNEEEIRKGERTKEIDDNVKNRLGKSVHGSANIKLELEIEKEKLNREIDQSMNGRQILLQAQSDTQKKFSGIHKANTLNALNEGTYKMDDFAKKTLGMETAEDTKKYFNEAAHNFAMAEDTLKKRDKIDLINQGSAAQEKANNLNAELDGMVVLEDENGKSLGYADTRTKLSAMRNQLSTEQDPAKAAALTADIARYEQGIDSFEQEHDNLNFDDFLDKNANGRLMARVNPELAGEAEAILKSESAEQIFEAIKNGGGTSEFVFTKDDMQKILSGRANEVSANARYGAESYLLAGQQKVASTSGADKVKSVSLAMEAFEAHAEGSSKQIMGQVLEETSPYAIEEANKELVRYLGPGATLQNVTSAQLRTIDITTPNSKLRDIVTRVATKYHDHAAYGTGATPGSYTGRGASSNIAFKIQSTNPSADKIQDLANTIPGGAERTLELLENEGVRAQIISDTSDLVNTICPGVDLGNVDQNKILVTIKNNSAMDHIQLAAIIQQENPNTPVNLTAQNLADIKVQAAHLYNANQNILGLAKLVTVEHTMPYVSDTIKKMTPDQTIELNTHITDVSQQFRKLSESGDIIKGDEHIFNEIDGILQKTGRTPEQRAEIITKGKADPKTMISALSGISNAAGAAVKLKNEFVEKVKTLNQQRVDNGEPPVRIGTGAGGKCVLIAPGEGDKEITIDATAMDPTYSYKEIRRAVTETVGGGTTAEQPQPAAATGQTGGPPPADNGGGTPPSADPVVNNGGGNPSPPAPPEDPRLDRPPFNEPIN